MQVNKEKISVVLDSEHSSTEFDEVMSLLKTDESVRRSWHCYQIIGAAIRKELGVSIDSQLVDRIRAQIEKEPTCLAPWRLRNLVDYQFFKPIVSLAVAASVATVAIFAVQQFELMPSTVINQVADTGVLGAHSDATRWDTLSPEMENKMNTYLVEHGEFTSMSGMNGLSAYAKFVSYDAAP
ncbi:MAG TPA: hypothetical protein ENI80_11765 [Acidiferrobacteraceae bacterium]|nr:hypothetical protein [Acidiferrobacteraceae bacterium]